VVEIDSAVVNWSDTESLEGRPLVVLLHGYGQHEHALDDVAAALPEGIVTAALRGPRPSRAPLQGGNGWWDVDEFYIPEPGQDAEAVAAVLGWLDRTIAERGAPSAIGVVGHSQGAALALTLLRNVPERFAAVVAIAGAWIPQVQPADTRLADLRPAVFWGRTEDDPAIHKQSVHSLRAALAPIAPDAEHVYPGAEHAVIPEQISDLAAFLKERLGV